jgi:hypothetical protein
MKAFGISDRPATILSFPALYGTTALFIYGYCKQLKALSRSKLIPAAFSWTFLHSNIPYFNLMVMTTMNYLLLVIIVLLFLQLIRRQVESSHSLCFFSIVSHCFLSLPLFLSVRLCLFPFLASFVFP